MKQNWLVDNSAAGNCMYYAYGISLMYFLRSKGTKEMADSVFDKLQLSEAEKLSLHNLIDAAKDRPFTLDECKNTIEVILGPATRKLAADYSVTEFLRDPRGSHIHATACFRMTQLFKQLLSNENKELADLLNPSELVKGTLAEAEIFRVQGMSNLMQNFSQAQIKDVLELHKARWAEKFATLSDGDKNQERIAFLQEQILSDIIREKTTVFFQEENNANLIKYRAHLNTNYVWASEETLLTLHRAVTGQRMVRDENGRFPEQPEYDVRIDIGVFYNGRPAVSNALQAPSEPDIVLNCNKSKTHWTSLIPPEFYKAAAGLVPPVVAPEPEFFPQMGRFIFPRIMPAFRALSDDEQDGRKNLLEISGFNLGLQSLQDKIGSLKNRAASTNAKALHYDLSMLKRKFIYGSLDVETFFKDGKKILEQLPQDALKPCGWFTLVCNFLLNALIAVVSLTTANIYMGTFQIVKPSCYLETLLMVNDLDDSLRRTYSIFAEQQGHEVSETSNEEDSNIFDSIDDPVGDSSPQSSSDKPNI